MCFGRKDESSDPGPKPAQIPQQQPTSSAPLPSKARMSQEYAAPQGPPPSHHAGARNEYAAPPGPPPGPRPGNRVNDDYAPPIGPPPSHSGAFNGDFQPPPGPPPASRSGNEYEAPPGPPPKSRYEDDYAPPAGPPPGPRPGDGYAPPVGPPPGVRSHGDEYAPPLGPPPMAQGGKQHEWQSFVPDNSDLPPPPNVFTAYVRSPANNATEDQAIAGENFCAAHPLPRETFELDATALQALKQSNFNLLWMNNKIKLAPVALGVWKGHCPRGTEDTSIVSWPPIYSVRAHSPLATGRKRTVYFEVHLHEDCPHEIICALGFTAPPYPGFRLPGWHRGSVGVHGDDGHKYINDRWGGKDFTHPFRRGETVGLGMDFAPGQGGGITVDVFLTRDGREAGRWNLHEETDREEDLPVTGLEGFHDLCATFGVNEKVSFEIIFAPWRWKWQGYQG